MAISVEIEKTLGDFHLDVNFEASNETLALLGASGSGKSITLKCIAGIEKPDRGRIVLDDIVLFDSEKGINLSPQERHTGLMFQNYALFPNMTVLQNISTGARREKDKKKRQNSIDFIVESFELKELLPRYPYQLSGGQQQRVALARMLVSNPQILLMDEPFAALDSHLRFKLEQEVRAVIKSFGKSVILVSHDRDEVYRMADSIVVMNNGRIDAYGEKHSVFAAPKTKISAILTGCKNISSYRKISDNRIYASDWGMELNVNNFWDDTEYIGIRMHDIKLEGDTNAISCQVIDEIETPFSYVLMIRPFGNNESTPIGVEVDKNTWNIVKNKKVTVSLPPDKLIMLK